MEYLLNLEEKLQLFCLAFEQKLRTEVLSHNIYGAEEVIRTPDLLITKLLLKTGELPTGMLETA